MLWTITSYFNPSGYSSRLNNYRRFRKHLTAPLITVELSFTGQFELRPSDAEILVQLSGGDVLWQKERLLNVALRHLPSDCDLIAWVDCDVIFTREDWTARARAALERFTLIQLFRESCYLASGGTYDSVNRGPIDRVAPARAYKVATGGYREEIELRDLGLKARDYSAPGLAWAAHRELLERHGLYDARIMGGGDTALLFAALGEFTHYVSDHAMNHRQIEHYQSWGDRFFADVRGRIGCLDGQIFHLWHGAKKDRRHGVRQQALLRFEFDPFTDIAIHPNGSWRWNSDKPELHEYLRDYFAGRNEDDALAPAAMSAWKTAASE